MVVCEQERAERVPVVRPQEGLLAIANDVLKERPDKLSKHKQFSFSPTAGYSNIPETLTSRQAYGGPSHPKRDNFDAILSYIYIYIYICFMEQTVL